MPININGKLRVKGATTAGPGGGGGGYGTLTTAWIAATGETDATILGALNTLETTGNSQGWLSKMKALYPFVGGTSTKHSYNFMNTAQYQLTFNGGWTHSSTGALPNGTNAYADTTLIPSSTLSSINSIHLSYYSRTNSLNGNRAEMGGWTGAAQAFAHYSYSNGSQRYVALNNSGNPANPMSDSLGLILESRINNTQIKTFKNSTLFQTSNVGSTAWTPRNLYIGAINADGSALYFTDKECAFSTIGEGLTDTEASNFYTAVQAFQTTLGRQV